MTFYMMVGLSGSGKSSFAKFCKAPIFSSDAIRAEVYGDENDQTHNQKVFQILHKRITDCLKEGKDCVYDATNLSAKRRKAFLNSISHIECEKVCIVMATPFEVCVERDSKRNRTVGEKVILKQLLSFQMPHKYEGWDQIKIQGARYFYLENLIDFFDYETPHDSLYHKESIQKHMILATEKYYIDTLKGTYDENINYALFFHDIGKFYAKTFINARGERTKEAHFYGHENASSYLYLTSKQRFQNKEEDPYDEVLYLIQYHMEPLKRKGGAWNKFAKYFDVDFINKLLVVNKYDNLGRIVN